MHIPVWKAAVAGLTLLLAGCSAPTGVSKLAQGAAFGGVAATTTNTTDSSPQAAVESTIERANQEQQQALAQNKPQLMSDTSTASYLQQMSQNNAQMESSAVKSIQLVKLQFDNVTVNGANAQATTEETWRTTFADSTVDQGTDQNVYTLVNQAGAWKIVSDTQPPSAAAPATSTTQPTSPVTTLPSISQRSSANWAGYAASGGKFTFVTGTWTIPQSATGNGLDASWVGIGGVNSRDLIQAGTQEMTSSDGHVQYQAWIETLPQASQQVPLVVDPGDSVTVTLTEQSAGQWLITLKNDTTGQTYSANRAYSSSESSAEWIEEAPMGGRSLAPLDNFGSVSFTAGSATENGKSVTISGAGAQPITMIDSASQPIASPSGLTANGSGFTVTRLAEPTPTSVGLPGGRGLGRVPAGVVPGFAE